MSLYRNYIYGYKIDLVEMSQIKDVDVVVIAVGHDSYKEISLDNIGMRYYRIDLK